MGSEITKFAMQIVIAGPLADPSPNFNDAQPEVLRGAVLLQKGHFGLARPCVQPHEAIVWGPCREAALAG